MGTSVEHIDRERTYGHLLPDAADHGRGFLEAFDAREAVGAESFGADWRKPAPLPKGRRRRSVTKRRLSRCRLAGRAAGAEEAGVVRAEG